MRLQRQGMRFKNFPAWNMQIFLEIYYMQESGTVMTRYRQKRKVKYRRVKKNDRSISGTGS